MDWFTNSWCCRFWQPGGDIVVCCPRDGSGPCATYPEPALGQAGLVQKPRRGG
jgi:hypothetical protein